MVRSIYLCVCLAFALSEIYAQNELTVSSVRFDATFQHISVLINLEGDNNLNSTCDIEFRQSDDVTFSKSARIIRAHPTQQVDGVTLGRNHYAASVMHLEPGAIYEIKINVLDPDGGEMDAASMVQTKSYPSYDLAAGVRYVAPGTGGGQGTSEDPFLGLQTAADAASPGDVFMVKSGLYEPFELSSGGTSDQPIVFKSEMQHQAVIDGQDTDRGIITLGVFDDSIGHIIFDGFLIRNGTWAIDAQNTSFVTIQHNLIEDVRYGFVNRRENGWEHDQFIFNNSFSGRTTWPQLNGEIPGERGVDIRGNNNVISFNYFTSFGDAISSDGQPYETSYALDVHNNDMINVVDDFIEIDGTIANSRVYSNRGYNGRMGVSVAPIFGGPAYIFRNVFYNLEVSGFKMNRAPAGLVVANNTIIKQENGTSSDVGWQNTYFRNNLIMCTRYCFEEYGLVPSSMDDWDFNAYYSSRTSEPWFKWDDVRYDNIDFLSAGTNIEQSGISVTPADLIDASLPATYGQSYEADENDLRPSANSLLLDSGDNLANINAPFVSDGKTDRGAYELGGAEIHYGPNFEDLTSSNVNLTLENWQVFPNPASDNIYVKGAKQEEIQILDHLGRLIQFNQLRDEQKSINVSSLREGLYYVKIFNGGHLSAVLPFLKM